MKMILANKCDMEDKRQVPKEKGETVRDRRIVVFRNIRKYQWQINSFFNTLTLSPLHYESKQPVLSSQ